MTTKKKIFIITPVIILVAILVFGGFLLYTIRQAQITGSEEVVIFTVSEGEGIQEISSNLEQAELISNNLIFQLYAWLSGGAGSLQAGRYKLSPGLNIIEIARIMGQGEVIENERRITFVEGWTSQQVAEYLSEGYYEDHRQISMDPEAIKGEYVGDFINDVQTTDSRDIITDKTYDFLLDKPADQGLEGFLFPDTYYIYRDASTSQVIEKMLDNFDLQLTPELREEIIRQNKTIFEVITLASIIEKELRTETDRKMGADVFLKRLEIEKPLQSDATVNYVTGKSTTRPSFEDVGVDSPYNTYKNIGLPPGPICNPSLESIKAVIYPEPNDYYYFLTKPDGTAVFSETGEEHEANKTKYLD